MQSLNFRISERASIESTGCCLNSDRAASDRAASPSATDQANVAANSTVASRRPLGAVQRADIHRDAWNRRFAGTMPASVPEHAPLENEEALLANFQFRSKVNGLGGRLGQATGAVGLDDRRGAGMRY